MLRGFPKRPALRNTRLRGLSVVSYGLIRYEWSIPVSPLTYCCSVRSVCRQHSTTECTEAVYLMQYSARTTSTDSGHFFGHRDSRGRHRKPDGRRRQNLCDDFTDRHNRSDCSQRRWTMSRVLPYKTQRTWSVRPCLTAGRQCCRYQFRCWGLAPA